MPRRLISLESQATERRLRLVAILEHCRHSGIEPVSGAVIHSIAYLSDALAPVWHLPILDGQVLKRREQPFFPSLQHDLDCLVGSGVVGVSRADFVLTENGRGWRLDADYFSRSKVTSAIMAAASSFPQQRRVLDFLREVVYAASGLGVAGIEAVGTIDAAYSDPLLDVGDVVNIAPDFEALNATAKVARRFSELAKSSQHLTEPELVHLYVRHLYTRMEVA